MPDAKEYLKEIAVGDTDKKVRHVARESLLLLRFEESAAEDRLGETHLTIAGDLGEMKSFRALPRLEDGLKLLAKQGEEGADVAAAEIAYQKAIKRIDESESEQAYCRRVSGEVVDVFLNGVGGRE